MKQRTSILIVDWYTMLEVESSKRTLVWLMTKYHELGFNILIHSDFKNVPVIYISKGRFGQR